MRCGTLRCSALNARLGIRCLQSPSPLPPSGLVLSEVRLENGVCKNEPHRKHTEVRRERIELCISDHWCWWCAMCDWSCPAAVSLVALALTLTVALALSAVRHVVRFMLRVAHSRQSCLFGRAPATPSYWLCPFPGCAPRSPAGRTSQKGRWVQRLIDHCKTWRRQCRLCYVFVPFLLLLLRRFCVI